MRQERNPDVQRPRPHGRRKETQQAEHGPRGARRVPMPALCLEPLHDATLPKPGRSSLQAVHVASDLLDTHVSENAHQGRLSGRRPGVLLVILVLFMSLRGGRLQRAGVRDYGRGVREERRPCFRVEGELQPKADQAEDLRLRHPKASHLLQRGTEGTFASCSDRHELGGVQAFEARRAQEGVETGGARRVPRLPHQVRQRQENTAQWRSSAEAAVVIAINAKVVLEPRHFKLKRELVYGGVGEVLGA
mmetsp:Transcript_45177/g.125349  ORF Transcript_45177/g.125349 Transcript_45177/m.125349 type:complete len:248 (+) Transcript_45177:1063-1806(+)